MVVESKPELEERVNKNTIKAINGAVYKGMTIDEVANQLGTPLKQIQKWVSRFKR